MENTDLRRLTFAGEVELKAKQDLLVMLLAKKFGPLPDGTVEKLHAIELEDLDAYIERVITATSLDEMQLALLYFVGTSRSSSLNQDRVDLGEGARRVYAEPCSRRREQIQSCSSPRVFLDYGP